MPYLVPTVEDVMTYLGDTREGPDAIGAALAAETRAQLRVVSLPVQVDPLVDEEYPEDLAEALFRRVARNLYMRSTPSGIQDVSTEFGVGGFRLGQDPEIRRLEAPFRRLVLG